MTDIAQTAGPMTEAGRIAAHLGIEGVRTPVQMAERVAAGLPAAAATRLGNILGRAGVVGPIVPEATLRRAQQRKKPLSREMSERLYEVSRVVDAATRLYGDDADAATRFLMRPHALLDGKTPLDLARSSSAGADAVLDVLRRTEFSFAL